MKKLYRVSVELDVIVYAEDERDAESAACEGFREELGGHEFDVCPITRASDVAPGERESLPWRAETYSLDDEKTVGQLLDEVAK